MEPRGGITESDSRTFRNSTNRFVSRGYPLDAILWCTKKPQSRKRWLHIKQCAKPTSILNPSKTRLSTETNFDCTALHVNTVPPSPPVLDVCYLREVVSEGGRSHIERGEASEGTRKSVLVERVSRPEPEDSATRTASPSSLESTHIEYPSQALSPPRQLQCLRFLSWSESFAGRTSEPC